MPFLHSAILTAGLAAISIPIIIHLLMRRRRKPIEWGAMRFVLEAYKRTRRRLLLEKWLLLAVRCLLVAALGVLLARPLLGSAARTVGGRTVYLLIDNSLSSQVNANKALALERHKTDARLILSQLGEGDRAGLIALGSPFQKLVVPASTDLAALGRIIDQLPPTDAGCDLPGSLAAAGQALAESRAARKDVTTAGGTGRDFIALLTDFNTGAADIGQPLAKLPPGVRLVASPPAAGVDNITLSRVRALRQIFIPGEGPGSQTVTVELARSGPGTQNPAVVGLRVRLQHPDGTATPPAPASVRFGPGERRASTTLALDTPSASAAGASVIIAEIDADALTPDNTWRYPVETRETLRVAVIAEPSARGSGAGTGAADSLKPGEWLTLALRPVETSSLELIDADPAALDASRLAGMDAAVVLSPQALDPDAWKRLRTFVDGGGLLVVFPPADATVHLWPEALDTAMGTRLALARSASDATDDRARLTASASIPSPDADLLAPVRTELDELVRPVTLFKILPPLGPEHGAAVKLLSAADGTALVWAARPGDADTASASRGQIIVVTSALDLKWTDLPAKPLMVPLMQELLRQGVGRARPALWTIAGNTVRVPAQSVELKRVGAPSTEPAIRIGERSETVEPC
ncbi:MAG: BatA domain-containing protein, partial [Phycisphaerales bacterium]